MSEVQESCLVITSKGQEYITLTIDVHSTKSPNGNPQQLPQ